MPVRTGFPEIANRMFMALSRGTMVTADDNPLWQELKVRSRFGNEYDKVESWSPFGMTSVPAIVEKGAKMVPETLLAFINGSRSHPIALMMGDRRNRPRGLKPGESSQYDDIGQMTILRRGFARVLSLDGGGTQGQQQQQQQTERYASLAHVEKDKQPPPQDEGQGGQQQQQQQQQQEFEHEGKSINSEVRVTKKRIEFRAKDGSKNGKLVGYYDNESETWVFIGKVKLGAENPQEKATKCPSGQCAEKVWVE